jgi:hypothetical protein
LKLSFGHTDAFLTHDWGHNNGRDNHACVVKISEGILSHLYLCSSSTFYLSVAMKHRGITPWIDVEFMEGDVVDTMFKGIENAKCVVVFITPRYMEKVNGDDEGDNCQMEFKYALRRKTTGLMVFEMHQISYFESLCLYST